MRRGLWGLALAAALVLGCGGSDGNSKDATDPGQDVPVADVPGPDAQPEVAVDVAPTDTTPADVAPGDTAPADTWVNPNPGCVGGFCAADKTHAPDPRQFGPFPVGVRTITYTDPDNLNEDGTPRVLKTEIWYPTTDEYKDGPFFAYDMRADGPQKLKDKLGTVDVGVFPVKAVQDAPVRKGDGAFPLVMFSHGAYGIRYQSVFFTVQLASHGYVVVAPDHERNTLYEIMTTGYDGPSLVFSALRRPFDIWFLMNEMAKKAQDPADDFYGAMDTNNVGMTGHSFGGLTSYLVTSDPRVKVIVPMAPAADMVDALANGFDDPVLISETSIPTMMMGGVMDKTLVYNANMHEPWTKQPAPKWFLTLKRCGHYTFSDICRLDLDKLVKEVGWVDADDALRDGCDPVNNWNYQEAWKAINLYGIGMLNWVLRGSDGSKAFLTPEAGAEYGAEIELEVVAE